MINTEEARTERTYLVNEQELKDKLGLKKEQRITNVSYETTPDKNWVKITTVEGEDKIKVHKSLSGGYTPR